MKNATPNLDNLLLEINDTYNLLEKLSYSETFIRKYADYVEIAELIQSTSRKRAYNNLSSPVHLINAKIIPILNTISEGIISKNPDNSNKFREVFLKLTDTLKNLPHFVVSTEIDKEKLLEAETLYKKFFLICRKELESKSLADLDNSMNFSNFFKDLRRSYQTQNNIINITAELVEANTLNLYGSKRKLARTDFALKNPAKFFEFETILKEEINAPRLTKQNFLEKIEKIHKIIRPYISELLPAKNFLIIENNFYTYNGKNLQIETGSHYDILLKTLYELLNGKSGEVKYKDYCKALAKNKKYKTLSNKKIISIIQKYLTSKTDGIFRKIKPTEQNAIPLVQTIKNYGIRFNNN